MSKGWAVVTGASSGIGEALALRLSRRGHPVMLVARRKERLEMVARKLDGPSLVVCADLSQAEGVARVVAAARELDVEILVNNAGFGGFLAFEDQEPQRVSDMLAVNISALVELSHALLPQLLVRGRGHILNLASAAAFFRVPGMAVYGASKEFVLSFSLALDAELRQRGVSVCAVCPGPVDTEFNEAAGITVQTSRLFTLSAEQVADFCLKSMDKRRAVAVPHPLFKLSAAASRLIPRQLGPRITLVLMRWLGLARQVGLG